MKTRLSSELVSKRSDVNLSVPQGIERFFIFYFLSTTRLFRKEWTGFFFSLTPHAVTCYTLRPLKEKGE